MRAAYTINKPPLGTRIMRGHPMVKGLVGAWLFNEQGGLLAVDASGNHAPATLSGQTWVGGYNSVCVQNNSASDLVDTGAWSGMANAAGTVVWAMNANFAYSDGVSRLIWGSEGAGGGLPQFACLYFSNNKWYVGWNNVDGDFRVVLNGSASNLTKGYWNSYAFSWDTAGSYFYLGGQLVGSNLTPPVPVALATTFGILGAKGEPSALQCPAGTKMHYFYIYDRRLSGAEILQLQVQPFQMFVPATVRAAPLVMAPVAAARRPQVIWIH